MPTNVDFCTQLYSEQVQGGQINDQNTHGLSYNNSQPESLRKNEKRSRMDDTVDTPADNSEMFGDVVKRIILNGHM